MDGEGMAQGLARRGLDDAGGIQRAMSSRCLKSMSLTRRRRPSSKRIPVP
jgi:hypothetical protein